MRRIFTLLMLATSAVALGQVVSDVVITSPQYANQVWYSLENGEVETAPLNNWDLAFEISGFTSSIRFNEQKGMALYAAPYAVSEWNEVDTSGMAASWTQLHDDPTSWERGAFNQFTTSDFDLGWGIYNFITHIVSGDSIYVIKLADGTHRKVRIDALASGIYSFTHAQIDGSDETTAQVAKAEFAGKNFGYYSFETNSVIDREPASASWDITFTKYVEFIGPNADVPYGVTGVLHNKNLLTSQADNTPVGEAAPWDFEYSPFINTIGYDWKTFNFNSGFLITEDQSFFVQSGNGFVYQITFTDFEGSATGLYGFTIENVGEVLSTATSSRPNFGVYPNPSNGARIQLHWEGTGYYQLTIRDLTGKVIHSENMQPSLNGHELIQPNLHPGTYLLSIQGPTSVATEKIIITN